MALKTAWELEAWTLPGVGAFTLLVPAIPAQVLDFTDPANGHGNGSFVVSPYFASLNSICDPDSDVETLLRVKIDGVYAYQFYARDRIDNFNDTGLTRISGPSVEDVLNHAIVFPFDYPRLDEDGDLVTREPDWFYGSLNNGISNPGFADVPAEISNRNFALGTTEPWRPGPKTGISVVTTAPLVGANHLRVAPTVVEGGATFTMPVLPNGLYEIDVWVRTESGAGTIELGVTVPGDIRVPQWSATTPDTIVGERIVGSSAQPNNPGTGTGELNIQYGSNITDPDDPDFEGVVYVEMRAEVAATTTYKLIRVAFWSGKGQTSADVSVRNLGGVFNFFVDQIDVQGLMVGLNGWQVATAWPGQPTLQGAYPLIAQAETSDPDTGVYHAVVNAKRSGQGIQQAVSGIIPGGTYTVTARIDAPAGIDMRLIVTDPLGNWIASDIGPVTTPLAYNTFTATFQVPDAIPGDGQLIPANDTVFVKIVLGETVAPLVTTFKVDNVKIVPGKPSATIGTILTDLLTDAAVDHIADGRTTVGGAGHLAFLQYDFTAGGDSALPVGSAWSTPANPAGKERVTIKRGMTYLQFMEQVVERLGYEWRIIWRDVPGEWVLQVYNPGGMGLDKTGTVSLVTGQVGPSRLGLNGAGANAFIGEGNNRVMHEQDVAADITNYGRRERYLPNTSLDRDSLLSWVDAHRLYEEGTKETHRIELNDATQFQPYADFKPGDLINVNFGSRLSSRDLPVKQVAARLGDDKASFLIDVNTDPADLDAVPFIAVDRILNQFRGIPDTFKWSRSGSAIPATAPAGAAAGGGGAGGALSIVVAAYNASPESKSKADIVCDGVNDDVEIKQAILRMQYDITLDGSGGHVQLTEGDFWLRPNQCDIGVGDIGYYDVGGASLSGVGATTRIHCDMAATHTGVQSTSRHGTVSWLLKAGFSGFIRDLSIVGGGGLNGSSPLAGIFVSGYLSRLSGITYQYDSPAFRGNETTYQRMHSVILTKSDFCTIENLQAYGGSWDETDPLNIVTGDGNGMLQLRGANFYNLGDGSVVESRHGVYLFNIDSNRPSQITGVRVYQCSGSILHINGGSDVTARHFYVEDYGSAGGPAIVSKGSNGNSTLELTDWYLNNLQTGLPFLLWDTSQLLLTMRNVLAPGYKTTIDTGTNSCRVDIANCRLGDISVTVGGTLRGTIATSTLGANTNGAGAAVSVLGAGTSVRFRIFNTIYDGQLAKQFANWTNLSASHAAGVVYLQNDATGGSTGAVHGGTAPGVVANVGDNLP